MSFGERGKRHRHPLTAALFPPNRLPQAGYTEIQIANIKQDLNRNLKLREIIRQASGETIDLKAYEADMRHLIDTYIEADAPKAISDFGEIGLLELM